MRHPTRDPDSRPGAVSEPSLRPAHAAAGALLLLAALGFALRLADQLVATYLSVDLVAVLPSAARHAPPDGSATPFAPDAHHLFLAAGSRVDFPLLLDSGSELRTGTIGLDGEDVRLEVHLTSEAHEEGTVGVVQHGRDGWRLRLAGGVERAAMLSLAATGANGGVLIERPGVWTPAPVSPRPAAARPHATPPRRPNVIIYLIDTLRRDRVGTYGYPRPITPRIDAFAAAATVYERAIGQSSWTKASVASMFTGVWPPSHGATGWGHQLPLRFDTLAERLARAGYRTAAFVTNPNVVRAFQMDQGFGEFVKRLKLPSDELNDLVLPWLAEQRDDVPFFLYVHSIDPHAPYQPPEPYRSRFAPTADEMPSWKPRWKWPIEVKPFLLDLYDAEIAFNDSSFGRFLDELRRLGLYDDTLVILVSDHGEEFKEHGRWRHGGNLHAPTLDVPLIVKYPRQRQARRVSQPVQHADVLPTVLAAAGLEVPAKIDGRPLPSTGGSRGHRVFSHLRLGRAPLTRSVVDGDWKLIQTWRDDGWSSSLFHLRSDPAEGRDLSAELPLRTAALAALLSARWSADEPAEAEQGQVDDETRAALEALGYVEE